MNEPVKTSQAYLRTESIVATMPSVSIAGRTYKLSAIHNNGVTTLDLPITVEEPTVYEVNTVSVDLDLSSCTAPTVEEALDKLADWLERTSIAIKGRRKLDVPFYGR